MAFRRFRSRRPVSKRIKSPFGRGRPSIASGQIEFVWNGRKVLEAMGAGAARALTAAADDAERYWNDVVWVRTLHPDMTGREKEAGRFDVDPTGLPQRAQLVASVELSENYPIYEEFGTSEREGHFPLRQTVDFIAPRIRDHLAREMRAENL